MLTEDAQVLAETIIQIGEITANLRNMASRDKHVIERLENEKSEWIDKAKKLIRDGEEIQKDRRSMVEIISGLILDTDHYRHLCEDGIKYINHRKKLTQREKVIRSHFELALRGRPKTKDQCHVSDSMKFAKDMSNAFTKAE